jgi:hypothetical protein
MDGSIDKRERRAFCTRTWEREHAGTVTHGDDESDDAGDRSNEVKPASRAGLIRVASFTAAYLLIATVGAFATGNSEFVFYIVVMVVLVAVVGLVHFSIGLPESALWALSIWGLAHMAGGLIAVPAAWPTHGPNRVLYSLWLIPDRLKYDQVVHAYGFGVTTWICWLGLQSSFRGSGVEAVPTVGRLVLVWAAGQGFGALNEVIEFAATLLVPETNVGGYLNTGWDLVANLVGATLAVVIIWFTYSRSRTDITPGAGET